MTPRRLSVATWNVHGFVGADGRRDLPRIIRVLRALDADVIALQEVDAGLGVGDAPDEDDFEAIGPALGCRAVAGPTLAREAGRYGNLLLSRLPVARVGFPDLSVPGAEPRGAIDACVLLDGTPLRILATHLGLRRSERARQAVLLGERLASDPDAAALRVLLGDLNEWRRPLAATGLAPLVRRFAIRSRRPTFPARAPLLALDRVLVDRAAVSVRFASPQRGAARLASDHLPVRAEIAFDAEPLLTRGGRAT